MIAVRAWHHRRLREEPARAPNGFVTGTHRTDLPERRFRGFFRVPDNPPGGDGKRYADLRDLPVGGNCSGSLGSWPVIASDLEVDPCQRYDLEVATNLRRRPQQISR